MKPVHMPGIECCPKCGATEREGYSAVDSIGGNAPTKSGEQWHCHKCDKWTAFRFVTVIRKMAPKFGYPTHISEGGKKYVAVRMFRAGVSMQKRHIVEDLMAEGFDVRYRPTQKDPRIIIVYAARIGKAALVAKRQNIKKRESLPKTYGVPNTKASQRAMHRWATRGRRTK